MQTWAKALPSSFRVSLLPAGGFESDRYTSGGHTELNQAALRDRSGWHLRGLISSSRQVITSNR